MRSCSLLLSTLLLLLLLPGTPPAQELNFKEAYALSPDRAKVLERLVPGTPDYYWYHCLYHQGRADLERVEGLLTQWRKRHGRTSRCQEIERRQALLRYGKEPARTLAFLRRELSLAFNHLREKGKDRPDLATRLDPELISRRTLMAKAFQRGGGGNLKYFEDRALEWLVALGDSLDEGQRRRLLARLDRPDHPQLVDLVLADLATRHSRGFGSLPVHRLLLLPQLRECRRRNPALARDRNFVYILLSRLRPGPEVDWRHDRAAHQAYLERLWREVEGLTPSFNSLKAHVLYHRLLLDREAGVYDPARFLAYLKLPRRASQVEPEYLRQRDNMRYRADLGRSFPITLLSPVGDDEPLVRSYLLHFFTTAADWRTYDAYLRDDYLKALFAEAKLVAGAGDLERWYSLIPPGRIKALRERVDLDFAHTNEKRFAPGGTVSLDLFVKNVKKLIVKVYQVNTANYYRKYGHPVTTDVNLDGLVPGEELVFDYDEPPLRRVRRNFTFPRLAGRGVWVIDFIGNGRNSRALIRKGEYRFRVRDSVAGHIFTLLDEENRRLAGGSLVLDGQEYRADDQGVLAVPYTTRPGKRTFIIHRAGFASLGEFRHKSEDYQLQAGFYVDREALLRRRQATLLVNPRLRINGRPALVELLEEVVLEITTQDLWGVKSTQRVADFKLHDDKESTHRFRVPPGLRSIGFKLTAKVENRSRGGKKEGLAAHRQLALNEIDKEARVEDLHLLRLPDRWLLEVRGKSGEARAGRPVNFAFKHRDFKEEARVTLKSDGRGRIDLGPLAGIDHFKARGPEGGERTFRLDRDHHSLPGVVHGRAGEPLAVPCMAPADRPVRRVLSLLERRGGGYLADWSDSCRLQPGMVVLSDLPPGDYDLWLKEPQHRIVIRLGRGELDGRYLAGPVRHLEVRNPDPLQIAAVAAGEKEIRIDLVNAGPGTRVHFLATRYAPSYAVTGLAPVTPGAPEAFLPEAVRSFYVEGRDIGDEYRYIINRKYARKFPGNMLERPGLLLAPWPVRKTSTARQDAGEGGLFTRHGGKGGRRTRGRPAASRGRGGARCPANLDFLAEPALVLANLRPDGQGRITVPRAELGARSLVRVLAVDRENTALRHLALPEGKAEFRDLRLDPGLEPDRHFSEQKQVTSLAEGKTFTLTDIATGRMELYDSLARVYRLYATLSGNEVLKEFAFLVEWPDLEMKKKEELYSKYACHELNFFLYKKDREFFDSHIRAWLANKKDKTFLDRWLLAEDLSPYLEPWAYGRLNVVERILLSRRIDGEGDRTRRHLADLLALQPPDIEQFNRLFDVAVSLGGLDRGDRFGLEEARKKLAPDKKWTGPMTGAPSTPAAPSRRYRKGKKGEDARLAEKESREQVPEEEAEEALDQPALEPRANLKAEKAKDMEGYLRDELRRRARTRQLYRQLEKTREWAENNYYHLPIAQQDAGLVEVNAFWVDFARHDGKGPFLSPHLAQAAGNFTEMALALAVLDLPFKAKEHATERQEGSLRLTAGSPALVFHQEIKPAAPAEQKIPVLVSQNFFRHGDRYRHVQGEKVDKFVTGEFLVRQVYGCHLVVTNPTSTRHKLELLVQIPRGAMPVLGGKYTRGFHLDLKPYRTFTMDYFFYFPAPGDFAHFPVHLSRNGRLVAAAEPVELKAVAALSKVDETSWQWVSQEADADRVLSFLEQNNVARLDLEKIAWRMKERSFFERVIPLLRRRHAYHGTLWSYGILHGDEGVTREYLRHRNRFVAGCGPHLVSPLLTIDPVVRRFYEHLEYKPLVNARAHTLGRRRRILNDRLRAQYDRLLEILCRRPGLGDEEKMALTYYLLLQDRVARAQGFFTQVDRRKLATRLQYDYFAAYLDFFSDEPGRARELAAPYRNHPVERWRKLFAAVLAQLDEIEGKGIKVVDEQDRTQQQTRLASTQPGLELEAAPGGITLAYQNLDACRLDYFPIDIELLFSRNPFLKSGLAEAGEFSLVMPDRSDGVELPPVKPGATGRHKVELPAEFAGKNLMIMASAAGITRSRALFAGDLSVQVIEKYGQLRVTGAAAGKALPRVYVKVYARLKGGTVRFYKDGYTDHRGLFDYTSLSTNELDRVERFAILVLSERHGAVVREARPPR